MTPPESNPPQPKPTPPPDVERELRFAVVMYGGVSLAIYINGVTQELLHMVRATARDPKTKQMLFPEDELSATEKVYRRVAKQIDQRAGSLQSGDLTLTRFVVDIISGTSAGGINGVFLAKALTHNQTMKGLKDLWIEEGDLARLLNDTKADDYSTGSGFAVQKPEQSLLNSQRMYRKLLVALEQMGISSDPKRPAALIGELDLFVTTTDIEGLPLPIELEDKVIYERRYRNVYHFRYAPRPIDKPDPKLSRDDFTKENDPFLAFAARCTSSFPFAFEAMQLADIETILTRYHHYENDDPTENADPELKKRWDDFFKDYLRLGLFDINKIARGETPAGAPADALDKLRTAFRNRSFGDGGYLDNKPFSYATSMLRRRHADCLVDRKLLYVEPTPEHPELAPRKPPARPDFAKNSMAAALDLPRQETIREDIERIDDRNQMLERVLNLARNVDEDVILMTKREKPLNHKEFRTAYLDQMMNIYGINYGAYHRLKIDEITNLLAQILARALGHDPESDATAAICQLVVQWRKKNYSELEKAGVPHSENAFLLDFDVRYSLRRLSFLNRRINQLGQGETGHLTSEETKVLRAWLQHLEHPSSEADEENAHLAAPAKQFLPKLEHLKLTDTLPESWVADFRKELIRIKRAEIADALAAARLVEEMFLLKASDPAATLREQAADFDFAWETMQKILAANDPAELELLVKAEFDARKKKLNDLMVTIEKVLKGRQGAQLSIASPQDVDLNDGATAARVFLDYYYRNFVLYDLVTYAVQYGTGAGETSVVKVYRISPEDAGAIMEESAGGPREKLAGRTLMSFGAFLDERWRKNDIIWGRLDGAERLINVSLPESTLEKDRKDLIYDAHLGILLDEFNTGNADAVCRLLSNARKHPHKQASDDEHVNNLIAGVEKENPGRTEAQRNLLGTPQKLDRHLTPETALKYISRSTNITGNMLSGLSEQYHLDPGKRFAAWMTTLGTIMWNLVAAAVPENLFSWFFRHWLRVLYVFAVVLLLLGILNPAMRYAGWQLLGVTVVVHLLVVGLRGYMRSKHPAGFLKAFVQAAAVLIPAALIGMGIVRLVELGFNFSLARWIELSIAATAGLGASLLVFFRPRPATEKVQFAPKQIPSPAPSDANPS